MYIPFRLPKSFSGKRHLPLALTFVKYGLGVFILNIVKLRGSISMGTCQIS